MAKQILGKIVITPKGEYDSTKTYERLDSISYNGNSYIVLKEVSGITPEEGDYYTLLAQRGGIGPQGVQGEVGPQGYTPQKGVDYWTEEDIAEINAANQAFAAEEVAKVVAGAPEEFDTLKEMSDWLLEHEDSAAAMNVEIQSLKTTKANAADVYNKTEVDTKTNILETTKVDKVSIPSLTQEEYDALTEKTALYYFIKE